MCTGTPARSRMVAWLCRVECSEILGISSAERRCFEPAPEGNGNHGAGATHLALEEAARVAVNAWVVDPFDGGMVDEPSGDALGALLLGANRSSSSSYAIRRGAPRTTLGIAVPAVTVLILPLFGSFYFDNQPNMLDSS